MPNIFKALATITAWILFVGGCLGMLFTSISASFNVDVASPPDLAHLAGWGVSGVQLTLAVVVMILRKKLE